MMFIDKVSIALSNSDKKIYREYNYTKLTDNGKKVDVILPFDQPYSIYCKNDNKNRIKLSIDIDGSIITNGFIVNANSNYYLDRFIDSDKKFLFVRKNHPQVALPSSEENGLLTIKVEKEKQSSLEELRKLVYLKPPVIYRDPPYPYWYDPYVYRQYPPYTWNYPYQTYCGGMGVAGTQYNASKPPEAINQMYCSVGEPAILPSSITTASSTPGEYQCFNNASSPSPEVGATIEGSKSDQVFSTTDWNGSEGDALIFQFKMLGKDEKLSAKDEADLQEYKRLKAKFEGK